VKFEFVYQYPAWFILLCLSCGALYTWLLYRKNTAFKEHSIWLLRGLSALRFLSAFFISLLLFAPLLRLVSRTVEKPIIVMLHDNSASVKTPRDSAFLRAQWPEMLNKLETELSEQYDFRKYTFDKALNDSFTLNFEGKETDMSAALREINTRYVNRNVGAIILASDGIFNKGTSPLYVPNELRAPIYTIALGDTAIKRDVLIKQVNHNQLAYLNNTFPVEVSVDARKLNGANSVLELYKEGALVESRPLNIKGNAYFITEAFRLTADKIGILKLRAVVKPVAGEYTTANNQRDFFIEVLDARQKVLILADAPHPDLAAIRFALQSNDNYEVTVALADKFNESLKPYSLVIAHQLPSNRNAAQNLMAALRSENKPVWFIAGANSSLQQLNGAQNVLQFNASRGGSNDVQAKTNANFALFVMNDAWQGIAGNLDPLQVPNASINKNGQAAVLFTQRIGMVDTQYPLFAFGNDPQRKEAVLCGEGIWRWRMGLFTRTKSHDLFNDLISRVVQYLSVRAEKRNLRITAKNSYAENEPLLVEAEVYNASYELINTPDVQIELKNETGKTFPFTFTRSGKAYRLDAGMFPSGEYSYTANTNVGGQTYTATGRFIVKPVVAEIINTTADHGLLNTLAQRNKGKMVLSAQANSLVQFITQNEEIKPVSHSETKVEEPIKLGWIFALIFLLLSAEWFVRRRSGAY